MFCADKGRYLRPFLYSICSNDPILYQNNGSKNNNLSLVYARPAIEKVVQRNLKMENCLPKIRQATEEAVTLYLYMG